VGVELQALRVRPSLPHEAVHPVADPDVCARSCLVVTAQLILDSLAHGFLKMDQISLLVLDEAHHAKSNHPFASILRDFYHRAPKHKRPKILGLTASPLDGNAGLEEAKTLEKLFDAKLVTAPPETQAELRAVVSKPTILQMEYDSPPTYARTELFDEVVSKVIVRDETFDRYYAGAETACVPPPLASVPLPLGEDPLTDSTPAPLSFSPPYRLNDYGPDAADLVWHLALERCRHKLLPSHESDGSASDIEDALLGFEMDVGTDEVSARRAKEKQQERTRDKERMRRELREKAEREVSLELPDWLKCVSLSPSSPSLDGPRADSDVAHAGSSSRTSRRSTSSASRPSCARSSTSSRRARTAPTLSAASCSSCVPSPASTTD